MHKAATVDATEEACRFTPAVMAAAYLRLYQQLVVPV